MFGQKEEKIPDAWDLSSVVPPAPSPSRPRYVLDSVDGLWLPAQPLLDHAVTVDISAIGAGLSVLPAIPQVAYIIGQPSIVVLDPVAFAAVGFAGYLTGTVYTPQGIEQLTNIIPLGGGFPAPQVYAKTRPGYEVKAYLTTVAPAASVAELYIPFTKAVAPV